MGFARFPPLHPESPLATFYDPLRTKHPIRRKTEECEPFYSVPNFNMNQYFDIHSIFIFLKYFKMNLKHAIL